MVWRFGPYMSYPRVVSRPLIHVPGYPTHLHAMPSLPPNHVLLPFCSIQLFDSPCDRPVSIQLFDTK